MTKESPQTKIDLQTAPAEVLKTVASLREDESQRKQALKVVGEARDMAHDYVVAIYLEEALVHQHEIMEDRNKPKSKQDRRGQEANIKKMEKATKLAEEHVERHSLERWKPRVYRYLGRVADYTEDYSQAIDHYNNAIKFAKQDPEYISEKTPRWLEYEAFLAFSILMSGDTEEGLKRSKEIYEKFSDTEEGIFLKEEDYPTWAIWMTGIPVRVGFWFLEEGKGLDKNELVNWLDDAEKYIKTPRGSKRWKKEVDFEFRKNEIAAIRREIA